MRDNVRALPVIAKSFSSASDFCWHDAREDGFQVMSEIKKHFFARLSPWQVAHTIEKSPWVYMD